MTYRELLYGWNIGRFWISCGLIPRDIFATADVGR